MEQAMRITVGADVQQAITGINRLGTSLDGLENSFTGMSASSQKAISIVTNQLERLQRIAKGNLSFRELERVNKLIAQSERSLDSFNRAAQRMPGFKFPTSGFDDLNTKLRATESAATNALTNIGRIAQDAPYGFQGIANNLNPALESFQRLKAETGSTKAAISAFAGSLAGAGGLGFALSLASSLLVSFGGNAGKAAAQISALDLETGQFTIQLRKFTDQLDLLKDGLDFTNQLNKLKFDIAFGPGVRANVAALNAELKENEKFLRETTFRGTELRDMAKELQKLNAPIFSSDATKLLESFRGRFDLIPDDLISKLETQDAAVISQIKQFNVEANKLVDQQKEIFNRNRLIPYEIQLQLKKDPVIDFKKVIDDQRKRVELIPLPETKFSLPFQILLEQPQLVFSNVKKQLEIELQKFQLRENSIPLEIRKQIDFQIENPQPQVDKALEKLNGSINNFIQQIQIEGLSTIGEVVGEALSGGDVVAPLKKFGETISQALKQLGRALIEYGVVKQTAEIALASANPAVSIAAGVAAIALATVIKNLLSQGVQARAMGGNVTGGQTYLVNENGPEMFKPFNGPPQWIGSGKQQLFTPNVSGSVINKALAKQMATKYNIPKFEFGGLITGPTFGLLGEGIGINSLNPEVIAPLSTLKSLIGDIKPMAMEVTFRGKVSADDLILLQNRGDRSQRRKK